MAGYLKQMIRFWPGLVSAALIGALMLGTLGAVGGRAESWSGLSPADWAAVRFTVWQAFLSAAISTVLAIPVARALARRRFVGRGVLVTLLGAPFILPVIVAVLGLLAVFGRNGLVSVAFGWIGLPPVQIYGLQGVVLAHVFFNLPLATRLILQGWMAIPAEQFRLAAALGFGARDVGRVLERPMLRVLLPGVFMVIFVIATTSFAVALTLGGGPRATTIELAIYQAFRFDFDLGRAALLGVVQFALGAGAAAVMLWLRVPQVRGTGLDRDVRRWDARSRLMQIYDAGWIVLASGFLLLPLLMVVIRGAPALFDLPPQVFGAGLRSVVVALAAALLTLGLSLPLAFAAYGLRGRRLMSGLVEGVGYLAIAGSPLVIGTGLFIVLFGLVDPIRLALPVTALVNAVMALPFALRALVPAVAQIEAQYGALADSLALTGWGRFRWLHAPRLRRPMGFAAGLAAALSIGDLGVITLFSDGEQATLPLMLYRLMAAYRMDQAAGVALLLLALSLTVFWLFDRGGRMDAEA